MIFIFSSTHYDLFKQNILNACCFPDGHLMRVRYEEKYLPEPFNTSPKDLVGKGAAFVFAEGAKKNRELIEKPTGESLDYRFFPIRHCKVRHAQNVAGIVLLDLELGEFFDYGSAHEQTWESTWDRTIKDQKNRPYLKPPKVSNPAEEKHGFYVYRDSDLPGEANPRKGERAWRSVIDRVNQSELSDCVTYRVLGFFRLARSPVRWFKPEWRQVPTTTGPDSVYRFRTGETILMKILLYGEANKNAKDEELKMEFDPKSFTSVSSQKIAVNGHYNEERILLPTVRGTDTILSSLSLVQGTDDPDRKIWAPQPTFVVSVGPSRLFVLGVAALLALSFLLASLSKFSDLSWLSAVPVLGLLPTYVNDYPKPIAAVGFMIASWVYLRKFPLK
jgi:hypothetical protein